MSLNYNRARADSIYKYALYFKLLRKKIVKYKIKSQNIYNINKKEFLINILLKMKRIFSRRKYKKELIK